MQTRCHWLNSVLACICGSYQLWKREIFSCGRKFRATEKSVPDLKDTLGARGSILSGFEGGNHVFSGGYFCYEEAGGKCVRKPAEFRHPRTAHDFFDGREVRERIEPGPNHRC